MYCFFKKMQMQCLPVNAPTLFITALTCVPNCTSCGDVCASCKLCQAVAISINNVGDEICFNLQAEEPYIAMEAVVCLCKCMVLLYESIVCQSKCVAFLYAYIASQSNLYCSMQIRWLSMQTYRLSGLTMPAFYLNLQMCHVKLQVVYVYWL